MHSYGGKEMADAFRTVRKNTIQIAEDIPEDQYGYRATPEVQTVAEELAHVAASTWWAHQVHQVDKKAFISFEDFAAFMAKSREIEEALKTKTQLLDALRKNGEKFAQLLESLSDEQLAEKVSMPPPVQPSTKTRFEMLLGVKEHEMHHRGKLMVVERLLGIVPHLTRARQQRMAAAPTSADQKTTTKAS